MSEKSQNIRVVVRVRPFNEREMKLQSPCVVKMAGNTTSLINPKTDCNSPGDVKEFTYDKSYWSHDGFRLDENGYSTPVSPQYADQQKVYQDLGADILDAAWMGYNCSLFAYGQTGSGKSYTVMGYEPNVGLVPNICRNLFRQINSKQGDGVEYRVTFSMLEIYNEEVRDLLQVLKGKRKESLKVRMKPDQSFYADGLTVRPVSDYQAIKASLAEGDRNRSIAATKMNETSSRAHTIVTINFHQNRPNNTTVLAAINLVDLAGSERNAQTGATGERFKESTNINQSLSSLGNILNALVKRQSGRQEPINYRNSKLTMLLKNALGGNSKTIMIAAISPAADNYEQTLSTLKYADRAKAIRTHAKVNESETDKLIRELMSEKERLMRELERSKEKVVVGVSDEKVAEMRRDYEEQIDRYKKEMNDLQKSWHERLAEEQAATKQRIDELNAEAMRKQTVPHLWNLNEDPSLCSKILHFVEGAKRVGNSKSEPAADIQLSGPSIHPEHAVVKFSDQRISISPKNGKVYVNGDEVTSKKRLHHNDRLCFGAHAIFVVSDPRKLAELKKKGVQLETVSYEFARKELARTILPNIEEEDDLLKQEVMSIMSQVKDASAISEEFKKDVTFNIVLVSALARGLPEGRTEAYVKVVNTATGNSYMWDKNKFLKRQAAMMELYQNYEEQGEQAYQNVDKSDDPFCESEDTDCLVGITAVPLVNLAYMMPYKETLPLFNYEAERVGHVVVQMIPCDAKGNDVDYEIEDPVELSGEKLHFKVIIQEALNLPRSFKTSWTKFKFYNQNWPHVSTSASGINPKYNFEVIISIKKADHEFVNYVENSDLTLEIWGHRVAMNGSGIPVSGSRADLTTAKGDRAKVEQEVARLRAETVMLRDSLDKIAKIVERREAGIDYDSIFMEIEDVLYEATTSTE